MTVHHAALILATSAHNQVVDITDQVVRAVRESGVTSGLCTVFTPHATAAVLRVRPAAQPARDHHRHRAGRRSGAACGSTSNERLTVAGARARFGAGSGSRAGSRGTVLAPRTSMKKCEVCGNQYDKAFEVVTNGSRHVYDCFACAIHALAPRCATCGTTLIGHGMESGDKFYCCAHCARQAGVPEMQDRA